MTVKEMAQKYYPKMWDTDRLNALVKADKLTKEEFREITGTEYTTKAIEQ